MRGLCQGRDWPTHATLPHPPIMEGVIRVIESAIREAWRQVCKTANKLEIKVEDAYEDQITKELWEYLNEIRTQNPSPVPGFSPEIFESVQREAKWVNCQNTSIDKQPDLVFKFQASHRLTVFGKSAIYDGLFVECKPIDRKHPIKKHYLDQGLSRFVDGTYAWAMQDGMMLGYAGGKTSLNSKLIPELLNLPTQDELRMIGPPVPWRGETIISDRCETRHDRNCVYQHNGASAGMIRVRHLWLK